MSLYIKHIVITSCIFVNMLFSNTRCLKRTWLFFFLISLKFSKSGTGEGLTGQSGLRPLTGYLQFIGWGCGHLKTRMGLEGPCRGWLLSRSLRAPLRNAQVSSWQSFWLQPEELTQGRSSECLMASLRSYTVTLPQVLTGQRPATTHAGGAWKLGDEEPQADLEAGTVVAHMLRTGPVLIWKSSHYVGLLMLCSLTSAVCYSLQPCGL